jgi:hypothetical protein
MEHHIGMSVVCLKQCFIEHHIGMSVVCLKQCFIEHWYVCLEVTLCFHCSLVWCFFKSLSYTLKAFGCLSEYFILCGILYPGCHLYLNIVSMSVISPEYVVL